MEVIIAKCDLGTIYTVESALNDSRNNPSHEITEEQYNKYKEIFDVFKSMQDELKHLNTDNELNTENNLRSLLNEGHYNESHYDDYLPDTPGPYTSGLFD